MRIIDKVKVMDSCVERYQLDDLQSIDGLRPGTLLAYLIAASPDIDLIEISFNEENYEQDASYDNTKELTFTKETFPQAIKCAYDLEDPLKKRNFMVWNAMLLYRGESLHMSGTLNSPVVWVSYEASVGSVNAYNLLYGIETRSSVDAQEEPPVVLKIRRLYGMKPQQAAQYLTCLKSCPNVYEEFKMCLTDEGLIPAQNETVIQGYTVSEIMKQYGRKDYEAYYYLAMMDNDPVRAISELAQQCAWWLNE